MLDFLRNLLVLMVIAVVLYLVAPDMMRKVYHLYNGLGILPLSLSMVILVAIPRQRRGRR